MEKPRPLDLAWLPDTHGADQVLRGQLVELGAAEPAEILRADFGTPHPARQIAVAVV